MAKLVIFDLDGTLYRAADNALNAVNRALADIGYPLLTPEKIPALMGTTTEEYCDMAVPGYADREGFFRLVKEYDREEIAGGVHFFDGVEELLDRLADRGYSLAVCSNGTMEYIRQVLSKGQILDRFCALGSGADDSKAHGLGRLLAEHQGFTVMIGDRKHDFEAAAAVGIPSIAACYGYGSQEEYRGADRRAESPSELAELIDELYRVGGEAKREAGFS